MTDVPRSPRAEQRQRELEVFAESSRLVAGTLDLSEVLDRLAGIALMRLEVDLVRIWLLDDRSDDVVLRARTGETRDAVASGERMPVGRGLAGWVVAQAEPLALVDVLSDERVRERAWFESESIRSFLGVPIMLDMSPIGVVACMSRSRREFTAGDIALASSVAAPAATAVRNAGLYAEALGRLEEIQAFQRVTSDTLSSPDLSTVLRTLVRETKELVKSDAALCSLVDPQTNRLETVVSLDLRSERFTHYPIRPGEGLAGTILVEKRAIRCDDYLTDPRFSRTALLSEWAKAESIRSMMAAPVLDPDGNLMALLWAFNRTPSPFSSVHEERLVRLAQQAALAIGRARSFEEERRRAAETAALLQIARASTSTLELRALLKELTRLTALAVGSERCSIALFREGHLSGVMSQFADGHSEPDLWKVYRASQNRHLEEIRAHGEAARLKQPVVVDDVEQSALFPRDWIEQYGVRAIMIVPLIAKDEVIGTMALDHRRTPRAWTRAQVDLAMTIAAQVALAVDNARNFAEAQRRAAEVETLSAIGETLTSTLDLQGVLEAIADSAKSLVYAQRAVVFELEDASGLLRARAVRGLSMEVGMSLAIGQDAAGATALTRRAVWRADAQADPAPGADDGPGGGGGALRALAQRLGYRGLLAVPVLSRETVLGAVCIYWDEVHEADAREVGLLSALARQAGIAIENARLVSDLRRTLTDLKAAQDTLVRGATLRAVGELAAGAAHHLNNLMAVVLGRTQLMLMREQTGPLVQSLKTIEKAAVDAADTVRRIQAFGRTERELTPSDFDLNAAIQEALEVTRTRWENQAQAQGTRIQVTFEPGRIGKVPGRSSEMREVVANLVLNAVDALPEGGSIRIQTSEKADRVVTSVADTGIGMTEEVRRRAYEPFFTTKGVKSTGLGLAVAYGTIRRHGGELAIDSIEGRGTTVTFSLPLGAEARAAAAVPVVDLRGAILVVDDESAVRELVADVLTSKGHSVTAASGGREGVARFAAGRYDVVLTDLGMPDMTGWEVARAIKGADATMPVLLITGWGDVAEPPAGTVVDGIITKPFDVLRLTSAVEQALRERRTPRDASPRAAGS